MVAEASFCQEIEVDFPAVVLNYDSMKVASAKKRKSEAALLDQATDQLLRAVKARMIKKDGRVDYARLRKEGYSDRFLARLEEA